MYTLQWMVSAEGWEKTGLKVVHLSEAKGKTVDPDKDQLEVCIETGFSTNIKITDLKNRQMKGKIWADISLPEKNRAGSVINQL